MSLRSFIFLLLIDIRGMGVKLLKKTNGHIDFLAVQDACFPASLSFLAILVVCDRY